jgi:hypothetical protein
MDYLSKFLDFVPSLVDRVADDPTRLSLVLMFVIVVVLVFLVAIIVHLLYQLALAELHSRRRRWAIARRSRRPHRLGAVRPPAYQGKGGA